MRAMIVLGHGPGEDTELAMLGGAPGRSGGLSPWPHFPGFSGSCSEVYLEKAFDHGNLRPMQRLRVARKLGETSLMFLVHPTLRPAEILETCRVVEKVLAAATRLDPIRSASWSECHRGYRAVAEEGGAQDRSMKSRKKERYCYKIATSTILRIARFSSVGLQRPCRGSARQVAVMTNNTTEQS
jgi:hypothetical protein